LAEPNVTSTDTLTRANEAVGRGSWEEARDLFQRSLAVEETPEALEGLGVAASWLDDADAAAEARERAYRLYRRRGDRLEAGRVAVSLAMAHLEFLGEPAPASGWLRRAHRVLEGLDPTPLNGWIALGEGLAVIPRPPSPAAPWAPSARRPGALGTCRSTGRGSVGSGPGSGNAASPGPTGG
jgi:tetratricopeptide (TPR) repeat protein